MGDHRTLVAYLDEIRVKLNYSATEQEYLYVVWRITRLRPYIDGRAFTVRLDHNAMKWILSIEDPTGRITRWCQWLAPYDYHIIHHPGRVRQVPDALSALLKPQVSYEGDPTPFDDDIPTFDSAVHAITRRQKHTATTLDSPTDEPRTRVDDEPPPISAESPTPAKDLPAVTPDKEIKAQQIADAEYATWNWTLLPSPW